MIFKYNICIINIQRKEVSSLRLEPSFQAEEALTKLRAAKKACNQWLLAETLQLTPTRQPDVVWISESMTFAVICAKCLATCSLLMTQFCPRCLQPMIRSSSLAHGEDYWEDLQRLPQEDARIYHCTDSKCGFTVAEKEWNR